MAKLGLYVAAIWIAIIVASNWADDTKSVFEDNRNTYHRYN